MDNILTAGSYFWFLFLSMFYFNWLQICVFDAIYHLFNSEYLYNVSKFVSN